MGQWLEYDPLTGMTEINTADEDAGTVTVHKLQNVEGVLERAAYARNTGSTDIGIKKGLWHYASIPLVVQYEMLTKHGVNINNKNHWPRVFDLLNRDYPYLKTTTKTHATRGAGRVFQVAKS